MQKDVSRRVQFWWWLILKCGVKAGAAFPWWARVLRFILTPVEFCRTFLGREDEIRLGGGRWNRYVLDSLLRPDRTSWFQVSHYADRNGCAAVRRVTERSLTAQAVEAVRSAKDHDHDYDRG